MRSGGRPNRSGIDWSDPAARAAYRKAWRNKGTGIGRKRGSGARTVQIKQRRQRGKPSGYSLFIGRALWQAIGEPTHVTLDRYRSLVTIHACAADWRGAMRVVGTLQDTIPRCSISEESAAAFDLVVGTYPATVRAGMEIRITKKARERVLYD